MSAFVPLPNGLILLNAGQRCDMAIGPCACGAWHEASENRPQHERWTHQSKFEWNQTHACHVCGAKPGFVCSYGCKREDEYRRGTAVCQYIHIVRKALKEAMAVIAREHICDGCSTFGDGESAVHGASCKYSMALDLTSGPLDS